jgi:hypothetical protein
MGHVMRWLALGLVVLLGAAPLAAAESKRSFIVGFPPYILGADQKTVLGSGKLTSGSRIVFSDKVPTTRFSTNTSVFLGGSSYRAELSVEFWDGRLAIVLLHWPQSAFPSVGEWRARSTDLYFQLINTYESSLIKSDSVQSIPHRGEHSAPTLRFAGTITLTDSTGSQLIMRSDDSQTALTLVYVWGRYKLALDRVPQPTTRF